jgi:hypothetical protein
MRGRLGVTPTTAALGETAALAVTRVTATPG